MSDAYDYDLIVIGGGPAGEKGAAQAAYFEHKTVLVEKEQNLGGACINTGTIASKTLRESALFLSGAKARQLYGIETRVRKEITLAEFMYRKNLVRDNERTRAQKNMDRHKVERVTGQAKVTGPNAVSVATEAGERKMTGRIILIATGSTPARPREIPFNSETVFDSDSVLEMTRVPHSMVIFGGGVIGCEYAGLFNALGVEVTLVHRGERLLDFLDREIGDIFMNEMKRAGVNLCLKEWFKKIEAGDDGATVSLNNGETLRTEAVLFAAGRSGNTAGLGLEALGIPLGKYGHIEKVNPTTYQTTVPSIYAAGDVIGPPALASTSMEQARLAMIDAFNLHYRQQKLAPLLPMGVYTIPEISYTGESEQSCEKSGTQYVVGRSKFSDHARGQIIGDTGGMIKLIFAAPSGKLLGAHIIGEMASELIHVAMAVLSFGGTEQYFIESVFNYPTLGDAYKYAAFDALRQLNKIRGSSLRSEVASGAVSMPPAKGDAVRPA